MKLKGRRRSNNVEDKTGKSDRLVSKAKQGPMTWGNMPESEPSQFRKKLTGIGPGDMERAAVRDSMDIFNKRIEQIKQSAKRVKPRKVK